VRHSSFLIFFRCRLSIIGANLLRTTLRILSEMSQAQALAKLEFISERIQLNEAA
jgi:hypothetical protein